MVLTYLNLSAMLRISIQYRKVILAILIWEMRHAGIFIKVFVWSKKQHCSRGKGVACIFERGESNVAPNRL